MKKMISGKYWIASISACLIITGIALACAGDWGNEYGTSNFTPDVIITDSSYRPFFYSNMFYYEIGHDDNHDRRFNEVNTNEWSGWIGRAVPAATITYLLQSAPPATIDSALAYTGSGAAQLPASLSTFGNPPPRSNSKFHDFLVYLQLARKAEKFALNNVSGSWEYEEKSKTRGAFDARTAAAFDLALAKQMTAADPFLKNRYWFQRVRNSYFNGKPNETVALFEQHEKDYNHDNSYYRAMAYAAGALYKQKNYAKANYYYSKVYDGSPIMRTVAHYSFHPQEQKDWQATLALCAGNAEKATLWQMLGIFYGDEGRSIEEIYKLDPKNEKLDLLLVRAINIYEQKFGSTNPAAGNAYADAAVKRSDSASKALSTLITRIAKDGHTAHPWVWTMAAGYLNTLDNKFNEAKSWYSQTAAILPKDPKAQSQLRLLVLINKIGACRQLDHAREDEFLPDLQWLTSLPRDPQASGGIRSEDALVWVKGQLAALYARQKDPVKAECFVHSSNFFADTNRTLALKTFLDKPAKTKYEALCAGLSYIKSSDIVEYQALRNAYTGRLEEAIDILGLNPSAAAAVLPGNPFNARIQDCHDCDFSAAQKIKYSKLSFLQKLKEIKDRIAAGDNVYTNSVLLGNAYYNMSHYGNARTFYECRIIGSGHSSPSFIDSIFRSPLLSMTLCTGYYTQALKVATTDEQRAKCQYLLAKCERNDWYTRLADAGTDVNGNGPDFLAWKGFSALRQYPATQYYKDVLRECGYFKTYTRRHPAGR